MRFTMHYRRILLIVASAALIGGFTTTSELDATAPGARKTLERVAFLGASITDGFGLAGEENCWLSLADVFAASVAVDVPKPFRKSGSFLFLDPVGYGRKFVDAALREDPTLVIGADFMFWFGYGFGHTEERRFELFDEGIALLERFDCPIVIGDYPNMIQAIQGKGFHGAPMIGISHIPKTATLIELNRRLKAWAAKRGRVIVLPLSEFVLRIRKGESIDVLGNRYEGDLKAKLLDKDLLHTNLEGEIALSLVLVDALLNSDLGFVPADFITSAKEIRARTLAPRAAEIAQRIRQR